jgi:outer membrane immunogenic protein
MKKILFAGAALLALVSGRVMAADMSRPAPAPIYTKAPMMAPVYSWTGGYIGVNAGYAWGDSEASTSSVFSLAGFFDPVSVPLVNAAGTQTIKPNGFTGGGQIGYNWQASSVTVFGLEADFEYFGLKGSVTSSGPYFPGSLSGFAINQSVRTDWLATFRARLGFLVTPSTLLYVTGGGAVTNLQGTFTFNDNLPNAFSTESGSFNTTKLGWTAGGGVEWAMWSGWSAKAEYLFVSFPTATTTSNNFSTIFGPVPGQVFTHSLDLDAHIVRVGLNYKFGGPVVAKY